MVLPALKPRAWRARTLRHLFHGAFVVKQVLAVVVLSGLALPLAAQQPTPAATPAAATPVVRQKLPDDSLAIARKYAGWVWGSQIDSIFAHSRLETRTQDARSQFTDMMAQVAARAGTEAVLVEEKWVRRNGNRQYWRTVRMTDFADEPIVLRIVMLPSGEWGGMGMGPLSQVPPVDSEP
jgi:hypothetical protein